MRIVTIFIILAGVSAACMHGRGGNSQEEIARGQAINVAKEYALHIMKDARQSTDRNGIITLSTDRMSYVIDPAKIVISEIDEDLERDAIVPLTLLKGQTFVMKEHLLILNAGEKMMIDTVLYDIINILKVEDRIINAEISKVGMDSPGYGCAECMEIARYQFKSGKFVKTE